MDLATMNNQQKPSDSGSLYFPDNAIYKAPDVQYVEDQSIATVQDNAVNVPPDRVRNFTVRSGFAYFLVTINYCEGVRVGLFVKHYRNQVIVSRVDEASLASESLRVLDRIIDVNAKPVTDKDVCKTLIVKALQDEGAVNMIIERPVDQAAIELMENALSSSVQQPPSVAMASDVKSIVRRYNEKLKTGFGDIKPINILVHPDKDENIPKREHPHVKIEEENRQELMIGMDHESKVHMLQKVPEKSESHSSRRRRRRSKRSRRSSL